MSKEQQPEIWLQIKGYEGLYEVSSMGRVRSLDRITNNQHKTYMMPGRVLKPGIGRKGYWYVYLTDYYQCSKFKQIHQLVAIAFILNPENKPDVNHCDGIKAHNYVDNLEWSTKSENTQHAYDIGIKIAPKGESNKASKLTELQVIEIRRRYGNGEGRQQLANEYHIKYSSLDRIVKRITWTHVN